ncbi:hypothetical protein EVAR_82884_1 [Eumeta japonica]|uniref:Uncharacterized protein n=1 Tax=Eumeta variegata TaxID=151549 RepID=A0A4C1YJQ8_EUMVA|nr:hypothetical protein EVAR_82884_1 [Eumeta japonica]
MQVSDDGEARNVVQYDDHVKDHVDVSGNSIKCAHLITVESKPVYRRVRRQARRRVHKQCSGRRRPPADGVRLDNCLRAPTSPPPQQPAACAAARVPATTYPLLNAQNGYVFTNTPR